MPARSEDGQRKGLGGALGGEHRAVIWLADLADELGPFWLGCAASPALLQGWLLRCMPASVLTASPASSHLSWKFVTSEERQ